jgi:hypothetical protein
VGRAGRLGKNFRSASLFLSYKMAWFNRHIQEANTHTVYGGNLAPKIKSSLFVLHMVISVQHELTK